MERSPTRNGYVVSDELRAIYHRWNMTAPDERNGGPVRDLVERDDSEDEEPFLDDLPPDPASPLAGLSRTRSDIPMTAGRSEAREKRARIAEEIRTNPNQKVAAIAKKFGVSDPTVYAAAKEHGVALACMRKMQSFPTPSKPKIVQKETVVEPVDQPSLTELIKDKLQSGDPVNHPPHYTASSIECIDAIEAALTPEEFRGYCKGNAIKYIWREKHKGQNESVAKAEWYVKRLLKEKT